MKRLTIDSGITKWGFMFNEIGRTIPIPITVAINWMVFYFYVGVWVPYTKFHFNLYAIKGRGLFYNFHKILSFRKVSTAGEVD